MQTVTYVYSAHSAFAYLGSKRLMEICAAHGATLVHRPILLSPVVEAQGSLPFRARTQAHVDYFFGREIERWAAHRDVPVIAHRPTFHDADYSLAIGLILALGDRGPEVDRMAHALLEAHWRDDADLSNPSALLPYISGFDAPPMELVARAASTDVQAQLKANIAWAKTQPVFGSPTYFVGEDVFYGQDRLELIDRALAKPFAPPAFQNPSVDAPEA